ncbi:hypothetical protein AB0J83_11265 [Actinoplanes sp. NPDC049596]|uniref:hypothetical protein n=1 Tax=unclassified Actinoplanes TaxID=2626549 RepID=UPI0034496D6F
MKSALVGRDDVVAEARRRSRRRKASVDACTLLKADEIENIIGADNGGAPDGGVGESVCVSYLRVVTDPTGKKDRDTAVRLVKLVRARLKG